MAWVSTKLQGHRCDSSRSADGSRTARNVYVVIYNADTTAVAAETASGIPALGAAHPDDSTRKVTSVSAKPMSEDTRKIFEVTVEYSTSQIAENPLSVPDKITWDFSEEQSVYMLDFSDPQKPVVNSAGEPFEDFLANYDGSVTATITRNIAANAAPIAQLIEYLHPNAVNSDSITVDGKSIAAGQAKFSGASVGEVQTQNGVDYRVLTIKLAFRESWEHKVQDRGFNESDGGSPKKLKEIVKGTPPVKPDMPWPLNGSGGAKTNADDNPEELTFKPQPEKAFSVWSFA